MTRRLATTAIPLACLALLALAAFNPRILKQGILTEDAVVCLGYPDPLDSVKLRNTGDETATGEFTVYYTNGDGTNETLQEPITVEVFSGTPYLWSFPVGMDAGTYNCTAQWTVDGLTEPLTTEFTVSVLEVDIDLDANGDGVITVEDDPLDPNDDDSLEECQGALVGLGDTMPLRIDLRGGTAEHTATLTWTNPDKVQIYDGATVLNQKAQPGDPEYPQWNATELPRTLQVEALQASETPNDITFQLAHNASATPSGTIDTMSMEPASACPDPAIVTVIPLTVQSLSGGGVTCTEANASNPPWLYVAVGDETTFTAHPGNTSRFPDNAPDWEVVYPGETDPVTADPTPTLTVRFDTVSPSNSSPILVRARCGPGDDWKTIRVVVCELGLVVTEITERPVPLQSPGRICLNAQPEYRKARYRAVVKPEGISARVRSTGAATVTFSGINNSNPNMLQNNNLFWVHGEAETGSYQITLISIWDESMQVTASDEVFEFYLLLGHISKNGSTPGDPSGLPDLGNLMDCTTDGTGNSVYYQRTSYARTSPPGFFESSFQLKTHLSIKVTCEQTATYLGNTITPSTVLSNDIWEGPNWEAVKMVHCIEELPYLNKILAFIDPVMRTYNAQNQPLQHVAVGVGSVYWAVDGNNYGNPLRQNETRVYPTDLRQPQQGHRIPGVCPSRDIHTNIARSMIPYPHGGDSYIDHPIERIYENSQDPCRHLVGYVAINKSSGAFQLRSTGTGTHIYWAGIDIEDAKGGVRAWDISCLDFSILPLPTRP